MKMLRVHTWVLFHSTYLVNGAYIEGSEFERPKCLNWMHIKFNVLSLVCLLIFMAFLTFKGVSSSSFKREDEASLYQKVYWHLQLYSRKNLAFGAYMNSSNVKDQLVILLFHHKYITKGQVWGSAGCRTWRKIQG